MAREKMKYLRSLFNFLGRPRLQISRKTSAVVSLLAITAGLIAVPASTRILERPSTAYVDATLTNLPEAPDIHAMDSVFIDVDHDGDLDVVVAVEYGPNRLYMNDGAGRLQWAEGAFGDQRHDSEHVRAADFDKDGNMDVVFVTETDQVHSLFLGNGKGGFTDASDRLPRGSQGNGLAVGDVNGDGLPDIVVGNTGELSQAGPLIRARNFLWLNDPARPGHFIDATTTHLPHTDDQSEGLALADMDGDGDLDLLVASTQRDRLLFNDGKGHFIDESDRLEIKAPMETREVHAFDANGDGKLDIIYFNVTSNNAGWVKDPQTRLLINDGKGRYRDQSQHLPAHIFSSWGGTIVDFNQDGAPDIIISAIQVPGFVPLQSRAWQNDGKGNFTDVTLSVIPGITVGRGWSIGQGDLDGDKKPDLFIGQWGTQARLLLTDIRRYFAAQPRIFPIRPAEPLQPD